MTEHVLSKQVRLAFRLRVEDLARLLMVCPRTVNNWDRNGEPTKLHKQVMATCVSQGKKHPKLFEWVHQKLEVAAPIEIVTTILARARWPTLPVEPDEATDPSSDAAVLRRALAGNPTLLAALERLLVAAGL